MYNIVHTSADTVNAGRVKPIKDWVNYKED